MEPGALSGAFTLYTAVTAAIDNHKWQDVEFQLALDTAGKILDELGREQSIVVEGTALGDAAADLKAVLEVMYAYVHRKRWHSRLTRYRQHAGMKARLADLERRVERALAAYRHEMVQERLREVYALIQVRELSIVPSTGGGELSRADRAVLDMIRSHLHTIGSMATGGKTFTLDGSGRAVLGCLSTWLQSNEGGLFVLTGDPGVGKTELAYSLCRDLERRRGAMATRLGRVTSSLLAASFFFKRAEDAEQTPTVLVRSLAYQIAYSRPDFGRLVAEELRLHGSAPRPWGRELQRLILGPLSRLDSPSLPVIAVVDALDECSDQQHTRALYAALDRAISSSKLPIKLIVTGRIYALSYNRAGEPVLHPNLTDENDEEALVQGDRAAEAQSGRALDQESVSVLRTVTALQPAQTMTYARRRILYISSECEL